MQATENNEKEQPVTKPDPQSQALNPVVQVEDDDDPEVIFAKAVAEIETQPLVKKRQYPIVYLLQDALCLAMVVIGMVGIVWQCITYPHMLVVLFTRAHPASITATLDVATRTLAPVTITRSATIATTGTGYQQATAATGYVTLYNGQSQRLTIASGSVFTGRDGEQIATTQAAVIPAANSSTTPPTYGYTTVYAQAVHPGASGNIAAFDVSGSCCAPSVIVKNLAPFRHGQDARAFRAVAAQDLQTITATLDNAVTQAFPTAFPLQQGEAALPAHCATKVAPTHQVGEEAHSVTLTLSKTCSAVAYDQSQLTNAATRAFSRTQPGASYHLVGSVHITLRGVTPLSVAIRGKWAYTFTQDYRVLLAQAIQGEQPAKARAYLLKTGVISDASIPNTLPAAAYITFLVLVG